MKYVVKCRQNKHDHFRNVLEWYTPTRGKFKGMMVTRVKVFDSYDDAEIARKKHALWFGEENTKITARKA